MSGNGMTRRHEAENAACALELEGLRLHFRGTEVLRGIDLAAEPGERLALLGPSGAGKTTLLRLIAGLLRPDGGDIRLDGRSVLDVPAEQREVVLVFQDPLLFPHLNVADNVGFGLDLRRVPRPERQQRIADALEQVQLTGLERRRPHQLSGGQRQRVALARALVLRPRLLLLDEPLSNLDPALRGEMRELLLRLHGTHGTTTLLVTHDREEALTLATRIALVLDGRIQQVGPGEAFYERPATPAVARFFGAVNLFTGRLAGEGGEAVLHSPYGALALGPEAGAAGPVQGVVGPVHATIRPEHIQVLPQGAGSPTPGAQCRLTGTVMAFRFRGSICELDVAVGQGLLRVVTLPGQRHQPGETVTLLLPLERIHLFPVQDV